MSGSKNMSYQKEEQSFDFGALEEMDPSIGNKTNEIN